MGDTKATASLSTSEPEACREQAWGGLHTGGHEEEAWGGLHTGGHEEEAAMTQGEGGSLPKHADEHQA